MVAVAVALWDTPLFNDPMHELTGAERTLLRKLDAHGPALSLGFRKGWMLQGTRYTDKALSRFHALGVARCWTDQDGVKIGLNELGRVLAYRITPSKSGGGVVPPGEDD